jgi:hypothetical protein
MGERSRHSADGVSGNRDKFFSYLKTPLTRWFTMLIDSGGPSAHE